MTQQRAPGSGSTDSRDVLAQSVKLEPGDPPRLGGVRILGRWAATDAGVIFAGRYGEEPVLVAILTEGAERDSFGRARFERVAAQLVRGDAGCVVDSELDDRSVAPWVALAAGDGAAASDLARGLLAHVTLDDVSHVGAVSGPAFRPHWTRRLQIGRWRVWPLPWPTSLQSVGRWTHLVSLLLVVAIAAVALWLVLKVFEDMPPAPLPPPPQRTDQPSPTPSTPGPAGPTITVPNPSPEIV
ncbi:MAG: hypothetical protein WKF82_08705 [Nocardioidaceae bacterium]